MTVIKYVFALLIVLTTLVGRAQTFISATGGTITTDGDYKIHTFTSSGTFAVTSGSGNIQVLVVAGGGSGGGSTAGGGGGGGLVYNASYSITPQNYNVIVGNGGAQASNLASGNNGQNSVFGTITAIGGGGGGFTSTGGTGGPGLNGGSGGGGATYSGLVYANGNGTAGQGNNGGSYGTDDYPGGGGGGAGAAGSAPTANKSGNGGAGLAYSISGASVYYSGGGGGGSMYAGGNGGIGGGGAGTSNGTVGTAGTPNTGGGGGGGWFYSSGVGGAGGSGIVIIKYQFQNTSGSGSWLLGGNTITSSDFIGTTNNQSLLFKANNTEGLRIIPSGQVGIATTSATSFSDASYKLFVEGGVRARKVKVDVNGWSDYVFYPSYRLPSLKEVEQFIKQHQHLPDVPSEAEVKKQGIDVAETQARLLKKIEELTLYIIEQEKRIQKLEKQASKK